MRFNSEACNMKSVSPVLCVLLALVLQQTLGDDEKPFEIQIVEAKTTCSNKEYVDPVEVSVKTEGTIATFNTKCTIIKPIPEDAICATDFYRKEDDKFKKCPLAISPAKCCTILYENYIYQHVLEGQNVPKSCPFTAGTYSVDNFSVDAKKFKNAPSGEFRANFTASLTSGECLYGVEIIVKIVDKA